MAGVYGPINSRAAFFALLVDARRETVEHLRKTPHEPTLLSIQKQLEAIDGWTRNNRQPTVEERISIDMGLRAVRELSDTGVPAVDAYLEVICALSAYFDDWPSDEQAASAKDTDPVFARSPRR